MMRHTLIATCIAACIVASPFAASAQSVDAATVATDDAARVEQSAEEPAVGTDAEAAPSVTDRTCLRATGTRIKSRDADGCTGARGRAYSREDIEQTGTTDLGEALRRLDTGVY
jgi:hypothetical protein